MIGLVLEITIDQIVWHSNTDKIGKLKYMIKLESDIWSNSNMWSKLLPIYGQSQIYGKTNVMVILPIYGQTCSKYMVKIQEDPLT